MMNLKDRFDAEWQRLNQSGTGDRDGRISLEFSGGRLEFEVTQINPLACSLDRLIYKSDALVDASLERLKDIGGQLRKRLTYLLEPLATIEADDQLRVVQMRSCPPRRDETGVRYYELEVGPDAVRLCRYQRSTEEPRQMAPTTLTREMLYRVAEDFAELS